MVPLLVAEGNQVTALTRRPGRTATLRALGAEPVVADAHDREDSPPPSKRPRPTS
ncbi:hypothetical protein ACFQX6_65200 [Streptosporangium lutulentum]